NNQVITRTLTSSTTYYGRWESSSCGNSACKGATVTVDLTAPTYDGYSNVGGYTYYDGTNYWVKGGNKLTIDIKHSDNVDVKTQYLTFCHDNCTPNGCGDAPHEIKSYNTDGSFTDWMANDSYLNITGTSIVAGGWGNTTITNRWTTEVSASCPDWDWYPYTYLHDWCSNGVGYTALGKWIRVDNTAPTRDVASVNDACWITNGTNEYTITIVSTEPRSGFGGPYGMMALVNYYSGETDAGGYFAWHPSSYVHTENQMACSGGGYVSKSSSWGGARIDLVSATTSTIGNQRTVTFTVRPHSDYLELNGTNKICMYTSDNCSNEAGWTEFATNFTSIRVPATPTGATEICTGGSATLTRGNAPPSGVTYYWQTSSTGESTTLGSGETLVDSPGSTTTYYVRPYSSSGCWGQASAGVTVTVSADPTAPSLNVATPASGNTVCVGATVSATFNAGSGGVDCGDEYQYTNGGSWSSYTPGTEITASTTGTNVIQIQTRRVCSGNGCDGAGGTWATKAQWTVVADPDVSASGATTICSGLTADLTSSGSNGTGTMSYQWQYYDGATWVNTGTNSNELTTQALAGTTDFRCQYSATGLGCTTATSNTVTVTVSTPEPEGLQLGEDDYVWTGAIDTKWDDADNWISYNGSTFSIPGNVPAVTNDVFFTTYGTTCGTSTPEISSATGNCKDITIESGHELKMLSAQILNVQGNWKNNGTFTAGNGTVTFNGAAQQTVYAGTSNFHNLTINNSSGIEMTSDLTVGNVLNMTLGNIDAKTNDKVLILGTATDNLGTLEYTNGYVLGNMKRWFSNTTNSDTASGLFPLGVGINNRHLLVEYTDASSGGSLTAFFNEASMGWPETWMDIDNVPIIPAAGDCPAFIIMTLSDEGYWDITPSTPSDMTGGKYNISLTGGGIQTINNLCNLTALKREGGGEWYEDGDHVQPTGSTSAPIVKRVGASGWSNWGMGGGAYNPLPINLLSFNAACQNREVTINWTTATETNNDYFTIERSIDAQKWNVLTQIEGAGNSNAIKYYTVRDDNPYDGISYYRLKQTDYNGQYEYFNPVSVRCDSEESTPIISYYPNPFTSEVVIDIHNLSATKASLVIYDLLGNKVYENIFSMVEEINKKFTIDLNRLPVGVYIASFVTDEYSIVSRIVKQF
ncbi:MAG: T9SS type A sorting domain-containing protein, partial [Bacteroidales bacterium]|nr:T9SS type A sorting domain-containing protein [Bacteroidales bacterium]